jgi:hypothetical protein
LDGNKSTLPARSPARSQSQKQIAEYVQKQKEYSYTGSYQVRKERPTKIATTLPVRKWMFDELLFSCMFCAQVGVSIVVCTRIV